jgi:tRNA modification GTPase
VTDRPTIFALSSGRPPAAIAVVRVSGPRAGDALTAFGGKLPEPRKAVLRRLRHPDTKAILDDALALWIPGPNTETGEDMVELHLHGGRAVIAAVLAELGRLPGLRMAEPGEFTRRAFESGKLDLTAVEGLGDLIFAETEAQRAQAMRQLSGALSGRAEAWREKLIGALALVEARIDFSDEADVPEDLVAPALHVARELADQIEKALRDEHRGERLREGLVVAIAGPANAGKSSLLNRLARREAAIVSPQAGTTRDVIEVHLDLNGYPVTLLDTAGIRASDDPVEQEGMRRARARAEAADLVLWVVDAAAAGVDSPPERSESKKQWIVRNKIDLVDARDTAAGQQVFDISAKSGSGVDGLVTAIGTFAAEFFAVGEPALVTRERHRIALQQTAESLRRALRARAEELIAEELRLAARALGRLTGRVDVEDVLDVIFRDFCIGK